MTDVRWKQRFENFEKAFFLLKEGMQNNPENLSKLEKEGIIQRFEYTFELAWKTLKDYLQYNGIYLQQVTPRAVIKEAFKSKVISDGRVWITMLEQRNLMAHTYNEENFSEAINGIFREYLAPIEQLYSFLKEKSTEITE
jgi:nucleotidyltransferase substrate binding protein (TIGR01987 family)